MRRRGQKRKDRRMIGRERKINMRRARSQSDRIQSTSFRCIKHLSSAVKDEGGQSAAKHILCTPSHKRSRSERGRDWSVSEGTLD